MDSTNKLSISDLLQIRDFLFVASERGAFKASEFSTIGPIFDRLELFVAMIQSESQTNVEEDKGEVND